LKAFGANPLDADIVSSLAFLSLKQRPPQADMARQMAIYSLSLHNARNPGGRIEDWTTLAIASALSGRDRDARNAWFISLALAPQPERQCWAAINAYAMNGERMRSSVEAMLYRAHRAGRWDRHLANGRPAGWLSARCGDATRACVRQRPHGLDSGDGIVSAIHRQTPIRPPNRPLLWNTRSSDRAFVKLSSFSC
jgi:hypothetical protein